MKSCEVSIYALVDPRDGRARYVGKANHMGDRLRLHIKRARLAKLPKCGPWIREMMRLGCFPGIVLLERCDRSVWREKERHHIQAMRRAGHDILNVNDGGDGRD